MLFRHHHSNWGIWIWLPLFLGV